MKGPSTPTFYPGLDGRQNRDRETFSSRRKFHTYCDTAGNQHSASLPKHSTTALLVHKVIATQIYNSAFTYRVGHPQHVGARNTDSLIEWCVIGHRRQPVADQLFSGEPIPLAPQIQQGSVRLAVWSRNVLCRVRHQLVK